ncbi:MAG: hypothetical protein WDA02_11390, partial [Saccharofermentanales bacterium]
WRVVLNLFAVWLLTGLWHGAAWNFVLWGLFYFALLALERAGLGRILKKLPKALAIFYTFLLVHLGFVLFNADNLAQALSNLKGMFGMSNLPLSDSLAVYYTKSYLPLLLLALIGATPLPARAVQNISKWRKGLAADWISLTGLGLILILATASMIDGSFNPFLYFRF